MNRTDIGPVDKALRLLASYVESWRESCSARDGSIPDEDDAVEVQRHEKIHYDASKALFRLGARAPAETEAVGYVVLRKDGSLDSAALWSKPPEWATRRPDLFTVGAVHPVSRAPYAGDDRRRGERRKEDDPRRIGRYDLRSGTDRRRAPEGGEDDG